MALNVAVVWEVRTTGADTNGGGFKAGATGTDWSQQNAAQYAVTDAVTADTTTITSASANFGTDVVGNLLYIQGGTGGIAAGWYEITVRNSSLSITVDRSTGLTTGTGATLNVGGALATINTLAPIMVASNKAFIKTSGGYSSTATITLSASTISPTAEIMFTHLIGYTTTRGDGGKAVLTLSTNTGLTGLRATNGGVKIENLTVDCAGLGTSTGIRLTNSSQIRDCKVTNFTSKGIWMEGTVGGKVMDCEVTGGSSAATAGIFLDGNYKQARRNWVHDNACRGITLNAGSGEIAWNLVANNTGASTDGIYNASSFYLVSITHNTVYASGRHGIYCLSGYELESVECRNNLVVSNGGYGVKLTGAGNPANTQWDGNAFYNNTSGTRSNMDDTGSSNAINSVAPYTNVLDVVLSGGPFTNAAGNDFTLNNTAGAGAACRAAGTPGAFPGLSMTGKLDIGAAQHADPVGGAGGGSVFGAAGGVIG